MYDLMKRTEKGMKSPLGHARGLGAAHGALSHWMLQRLTAIANLFLMLWFVTSMLDLIGVGYEQFVQWLAQPINAILMCAFMVSAYTHALLGLQVVIEDYVHNEGMKIVKLVIVRLAYWLGLIATLFSILKIAFGYPL
jgi:succinate dehydrogenase / fumarate reductase membrane anchor subunit